MITLEHMPELTKDAARLLRRGGPSKVWAEIVEDIERGRAQLFFVTNGSYLVLQKQQTELLILAAAGLDADVLMTLCIQVARVHGLKNVIFHTSKKGLPRLLKEFKPVEIQRTYRIKL